MKNIKYIIGLFLTLAFFASCEEETFEFGDIITPSDLQLSAQIVGQNADDPYGDGSGEVIFTATASNVITYKYIYNGAESMASAGTKKYSFGNTGINKYTVTVVAIGTGGVTASKTMEVEVLATYAPPADLLLMLTGDGERTWRVKAEGTGHFGVGPADGIVPL